MTRIHCKVYNLSYNLRRKEIKQIGIKIKLQPNTKASQKLKKNKRDNIHYAKKEWNRE